MNTVTGLESRKYQLISQITRLDNEALLLRLEQVLREGTAFIQPSVGNPNLFKPIRKKLKIADIKKEQRYKGMNLSRMDQSIEALDIQESIEVLLADLKP